jgi:hypothetical protein
LTSALNGTPTSPTLAEAAALRASTTAIDSCFVSDLPALSVARTVKIETPFAVGVPLIVPLGVRVRPAGSAPFASDHV